MSTSSESEEFYDAEDITPNRSTRRSRSIKRSTLSTGEESLLSSSGTSQRESLELDETLLPQAESSSGDTTNPPSNSVPTSVASITPPSSSGVEDSSVPKESSSFENVIGDKKTQDSWQGRRRFRELRQRMQTEEEDAVGSPPDSQTSSVEGIFAVPQPGTASASSSSTGTKVSHPFRIIEHDALSLQSLTSLGRVGRILGGIQDTVATRGEHALTAASSSSTLGGDLKEEEEEESSTPVTAQTSPRTSSPSVSSTPSTSATTTSANTPSASTAPPSPLRPSQPQADSAEAPVSLQEPDVIASTKCSINNGVFNIPASGPSLPSEAPVAPPRRKKKNKAQSVSALVSEADSASQSSSQLPSPASTIESLTRELEHSLDIRSATKGQYVVKPQDEDKARAEGPSTEELERLKHDLVSARSSQASSSPRGSVGGNSIGRKPSVLGSVGETEGSTAPVTIPGAGSGTASSTSSNSMRDFISVGTGSGGKRGRSTLGSLSSNSIGRDGMESGRHSLSPRGSKERRRSAGDEQGLMNQLNMFVRTRTDSGKQLTDMEILEQVTVLNLDTGERVPLSVAEDKLPQCMNPLSLHIMRLTSEYVSTDISSTVSLRPRESDEDSISSKRSVPLSVGDVADDNEDAESEAGSVRKRTARLKRFLGSTVKKTMHKAKSIAQEVSHARHKEDVMDIVDKVNAQDQNMKLKASNSHKGPYEFDSLQHVQDLSGEHTGPVWCMKFSTCGRLLATAGQDRILRVWVIRSAYAYFQEMRTKYNAEKVSPTPSQESLVSQNSAGGSAGANAGDSAKDTNTNSPFMPRPFCKYTGHTSDLLDVSWSKNYFVLSSSMDKTVRLWHISRKECLCCFQHIDFVTAIAFHPRDDRYFLSGSLDGKLRLWNIPDKKVAVWNEVEGPTKLITAANFCQNGRFAVVGSYDGRCIFYHTDQLKYHTCIHVRSTRGKNSTGRKISGIEPMPGAEKILVTSNDSRIRLYDLRDLSVSCKYKGYVNVSSQIKASFSHDAKYIVSGSENQCIYIWRTDHEYAKYTSVRKDRNDFWEGIKAHNAVVTCAVFAPNPEAIFRQIEDQERKDREEEKAETKEVEDPLVAQHKQGCGGHLLVSADFNGFIKVFINKMKPKHSSLPASALV